MLAFLEVSEAFTAWLWRASWQGALLAVLVFAVQKLLGDRLAPRVRYGLWMVVIIRLVAPTLPASPTSVFNLDKLRSAATSTATVGDDAPATMTEMAALDIAADHPKRITPGANKSTPAAAVARQPAASLPEKAATAVSLFPSILTWAACLGCVWAVGAFVMLWRLVWNVRQLHHAMEALEPIADQALLLQLRDCQQQIGTRTQVHAVWSDELESPALAGAVRPWLVVPRRLAAELSAEDLRMVFLHELAHLKRSDVLANWLLAGVELLHWFNPLVWWATARCRADRELACDATVLASLPPGQRRQYGLAILNIVEQISRHGVRPPALGPAAVGIVERTSHIHRRIAMVATYERYTGRWSALGGLLVILTVALVALTNATDASKQAQAAAAEPPAAPVLDARLAGPAMDIEFGEIPLGDVFDFLAEKTGLNVVVEWKSLEGAGINRDTPVSLHLKQVRPAQAFDWTLRLIATPSGTPLAWWIDEDMLVVTTRVRSLRQQATIVRYSLKDLIPEGADEDAAVQDLVHIIPTFVGRHDDWEINGGANSVQPLGDAVVVKTTPENHRQLTLLLAALAKPEGDPKWLAAVDAGAVKSLEQRSNFEFSDTPLADAIQFCQEACGVNVVVNWKALADLGIPDSTPVSLKLNNRSTIDALRRIAAQVSSDEGNPIVVQLVDNVAYVTSAAELGPGVRAIAAYRLPAKVVRMEDGTGQFAVMTLSTVGNSSDWVANGGFTSHVDFYAGRYAVLLAPLRHHEELLGILKQE